MPKKNQQSASDILEENKSYYIGSFRICYEDCKLTVQALKFDLFLNPVANNTIKFYDTKIQRS